MNILYEGLKEKGALMLVPSTAVESMGLGGMLGAAALRQQTLSHERGRRRRRERAGRLTPTGPAVRARPGGRACPRRAALS